MVAFPKYQQSHLESNACNNITVYGKFFKRTECILRLITMGTDYTHIEWGMEADILPKILSKEEPTMDFPRQNA